MTTERIVLGLGEMGSTRDGNKILTALGLGSCVCVVVISPAHRFSAMAHVVLPGGPRDGDPSRPTAYYAATAVASLLTTLVQQGISKHAVTIKLVGGSFCGTSTLAIGQRNILSVRQTLAQCGLRAAAEDVGGDLARSVEVHAGDLGVRVTAPCRAEIIL